MEELLNKLIEKGWKPFGHNAIKLDYDGMKTRYGYGAITYLYRDSYIDDYGDEVEYEEWRRQFNLRELVSKESGLWQFVCENKLVKTKDKKVRFMYEDLERTQNYFSWYGYEYRIIESALKDEEDLEKFLLDNIKIS